MESLAQASFMFLESDFKFLMQTRAKHDNILENDQQLYEAYAAYVAYASHSKCVPKPSRS